MEKGLPEQPQGQRVWDGRRSGVEGLSSRAEGLGNKGGVEREALGILGPGNARCPSDSENLTCGSSCLYLSQGYDPGLTPFCLKPSNKQFNRLAFFSFWILFFLQ
jgi:hypothetical protein